MVNVKLSICILNLDRYHIDSIKLIAAIKIIHLTYKYNKKQICLSNRVTIELIFMISDWLEICCSQPNNINNYPDVSQFLNQNVPNVVFKNQVTDIPNRGKQFKSSKTEEYRKKDRFLSLLKVELLYPH